MNALKCKCSNVYLLNNVSAVCNKRIKCIISLMTSLLLESGIKRKLILMGKSNK